MAVRSRQRSSLQLLAPLLFALLLLASSASASLTPLIDYIIPVWPSVSCGKPGFDPPICPTADGICQAPAPSTPLANYLSQVQARVAAFPNFFYFTAQCRNSLVLRGAAECYFVFDQTALRTGIAAIKNVGPYPGISLLTCVLQLDAGPPKTSAVCFDKGGVDPAHPYVVARVESGVPEYNLQQVKRMEREREEEEEEEEEEREREKRSWSLSTTTKKPRTKHSLFSPVPPPPTPQPKKTFR